MANLSSRVHQLYNDLTRFPDGGNAYGPLVIVYNKLLRDAKQEFPEDPVLSAMDTLSPNRTDARTLQALVGQVLAVLDN